VVEPVNTARRPELTPRHTGYLLSIVTLIYGLNYLDRGLIVLLLQPIKDDLRLSDTQLGFLTGIAFALFYATLGLPIARWADRGNRVTITSAAIGLWGVTVMSCVLVTNFVQLLLARVAAAVGEAGCMPPTYSLVGDYFPSPTQRARAMAVYWLGNPLAAVTSFIIGGRLNEAYGWRTTFFLMGLPGLAMAVIAKLTLIEPRNYQRDRSTGRPATASASSQRGRRTTATPAATTQNAKMARLFPDRSWPTMSHGCRSACPGDAPRWPKDSSERMICDGQVL